MSCGHCATSTSVSKGRVQAHYQMRLTDKNNSPDFYLQLNFLFIATSIIRELWNIRHGEKMKSMHDLYRFSFIQLPDLVHPYRRIKKQDSDLVLMGIPVIHRT